MKYEYILVEFNSWYGLFDRKLYFIVPNSNNFEKYVAKILLYIQDNYSGVEDIKIKRSLQSASEANDDIVLSYTYLTDKSSGSIITPYYYNLCMKEDLRRVNYRGTDYEKYTQ